MTSEWQHLEVLFFGSTSGPLLVCCLSLPRGKKGKCHPPADVGPFAISVTCLLHGRSDTYTEKNVQKSSARRRERSNLGSCGHFVVSFGVERLSD